MSMIINRLKRDGFVKDNLFILDLGGGDGRHSLPLLSRATRIDIVDKNEPNLSINNKKVRYHEKDFRNAPFGKTKYDIIIANNSLPFLGNKSDIDEVITNALHSLKPGGVFMFTLFGKKHDWNNEKFNHIYFHSKKETTKIEKTLKTICKKLFLYIEYRGLSKIMNGDKVQWHSYEIWVVKP